MYEKAKRKETITKKSNIIQRLNIAAGQIQFLPANAWNNYIELYQNQTSDTGTEVYD
jgi:hypothetical protein